MLTLMNICVRSEEDAVLNFTYRQRQGNMALKFGCVVSRTTSIAKMYRCTVAKLAMLLSEAR
jgi:hypothetical protein